MLKRLAVLAPAFILAACTMQPQPIPVSAFEAALQPLCGQAFEGRIVTTDAADDDWRAQRLVMHVRTCEPGFYAIPLHVGTNRSRTWVLMQVGARWELRHDHRRADGEPDPLTQYGGFAAGPAASLVQEFPADEATKALFDAQGIPVSKANVWTVEIDPEAGRFIYQLQRPGRLLRAEFDTSSPIAVPPPPWGWPD